MANLDYAVARVGQPTGRKLVMFKEDEGGERGVRAMAAMGMRMARASDFAEGAIPAQAWAQNDGVMFDELGVACVAAATTRGVVVSEMLAKMSDVEHVEDEMIRYVTAWEVPAGTIEYLRGYRDGVNQLIDRLLAEMGSKKSAEAEVPSLAPGTPPSEAEATWGLRVSNVINSPYTGRGVKVAILDTGLDLTHPDFAGRTIVSASFIQGEEVQDGHGHGTHTAGTACGPRLPGQLPRYGVACDAELYIAKVLGNRGNGPDAGILAGMDWAIRSGCRVISMSLGAITGPSMAYERAAQQALKKNALIIAAAGNESRRDQNRIAPVDSPANCPSVIAVGAIDAAMEVAFFSCAGGPNDLPGAQVDIAGPGVDIHSSYKGGIYRRQQGTSMATPHVAGIAALMMEANPSASAADIWNMLIQTAKPLSLPASDVGVGLAQAPLGPWSASLGAGSQATPAPAQETPAKETPMLQVSVSVDMEHGADIDEVAGKLRAMGMVTSSVLAELGQVTGMVPVEKVKDLETVKGVIAVDHLKGGVKVPPPGADVQ